MRQPILSMLLLASVALSSSNLISIDGESVNQRDNTYSNKLNSRDLFYKIFCKPNNHQNNEVPQLCKYFRPTDDISKQDYNAQENDYADDKIERDDKYDGEGYRKEQWHNYPRQLDRLQKYPYDRDKLTSRIKHKNQYVVTNEYILGANDKINSIYDAILATTNPILLLKIRLSCLSDRINTNNDTMANEPFYDIWDPKNYGDRLAADSSSEDVLNYNTNEIPIYEKFDDTATSVTEDLPVQKRIFSLWSRLQSLSHEKGHELHHRRYLHAIYGHPNLALAGDVALTAETRAALMRPPGSPLRWG